jgi:BirA family transcriptional regulator, biotin operon repressor / biotin---[acetyl-CoA-carboxylase] ligase
MGDDPASRGATSAPPWAATLRPERWVVQWFSTLDSTNRWLMDRARAGAPAGLVAVADHQGAGRGRRGRAWDAAPGSSLLVSVLLRPRIEIEQLHVVTMRVALAIADALEAVAELHVQLKWPNDVVVGPRKLAGLLAEAEIAGGSVVALVVGAGCNLTQTEFPEELSATATSVALETGVAPERDAVLDGVLERLDARLDAPLDAIRADYRARLSTIGRDVRVELDDGLLTGRARDVDRQGRLLVEQDDGRVVAVSVGDVVHLR